MSFIMGTFRISEAEYDTGCRIRGLLLGGLMGLAFLAGCVATAPKPKAPAATEIGLASYYADRFHGRLTANGERYDRQAFTAAHRHLPFGTRVVVTRLDDRSSVTVRINDRGPFVRGRIIDLSHAAAQKLGMLRLGVVKVRIVRLE